MLKRRYMTLQHVLQQDLEYVSHMVNMQQVDLLSYFSLDPFNFSWHGRAVVKALASAICNVNVVLL